jgi:hypothetical protein
MECAPEGDVDLLDAATDAEQWHAALDAGGGERKRQRVASGIVRLVTGVRLDSILARMNIGARTGQKDAVDRCEQVGDVGEVGRAGKHQRQRPGDFGDGAKVTLADPLRGVPVFNEVLATDNSDHRSRHRTALAFNLRRSSNAASRRSRVSMSNGRGMAKLNLSQPSPPGPNWLPGLGKT